MNDLWEACVQENHLALLYKANSSNKVAVKTVFGKTERKLVKKIVLQGKCLAH